MGNMFAYIICLIITLSAAQVSAAGDPSAGAQKVQTCSVCHGLNGNSVNPVWPKLAGQHAEYTLKQLQGFKNGGRANPQMTPMASALSDQDMQDIAAYYAGQSLQQTPVPSPSPWVRQSTVPVMHVPGCQPAWPATGPLVVATRLPCILVWRDSIQPIPPHNCRHLRPKPEIMMQIR
jgi:cytochrome c553